MKNYKSESTEIPSEWDLTSSETTKYHNTNIVPKLLKENEPQMFEFNVEEFTKIEYEGKILEQNRADIDYIAIMTGVDL